MGRTVRDLCRAIDGRLLRGDPDDLVTPGRVRFISGREAGRSGLGERLLAQGVACVVVRGLPGLDSWGSFAVISVASLGAAYQAFAAWHRQCMGIPLVQVIGTAGKTTTAEMLVAALRPLNPLMSEASDQDGLALSLLRVGREHKVAVMAADTSRSGMMQQISRMLRPDVLVLTTIQTSPEFASLEAATLALAEAIELTNPRGLLLINGDDTNASRFPTKRFKGKVLSYGFSDWHDIQARDLQMASWRTNFTVWQRGLAVNCTLNTFGDYNVGNALAAAAAANHLGIEPAEIAAGLASWRPSAGRLQVNQCRDGLIYIDDSHRASPESTQQLLQTLTGLTGLSSQYRLVLVLGDMLGPTDDLAAKAASAHYAIGLELAKLQPTRLLAIGLWADEYLRGAKAGGVPDERMRIFARLDEAEDFLLSVVEPASLVVLKGDARFVKLARLAQALGERP